MAPVLGYWKLRGLAEPVRYLLWYTGTEYQEKLYEMTGEPGNWSRSDWLDVKFSLGLEFPNLPYWMEGDIKITETRAILEHLARRHGLAGEGEAQQARLGMVAGILKDTNSEVTSMCYKPDYEKLRADYTKVMADRVAKVAKILGGGDYVLGDKISYADFMLFELLERWLAMFPEALNAHPNLVAFVKRMKALPAIQKYRASATAQSFENRWNNKIAHWGSGV